MQTEPATNDTSARPPRAPVRGLAAYRVAIGEWLILRGYTTVPIPGSGPIPSALGYQLERLDIYSHDEQGREIAPRRAGGNYIPVRDDSHLWNRTVGRDIPNMRAVLEATLTDSERRLLTLGTRMAAVEIQSTLGLTQRQYRRAIERVNGKIRGAIGGER